MVRWIITNQYCLIVHRTFDILGFDIQTYNPGLHYVMHTLTQNLFFILTTVGLDLMIHNLHSPKAETIPLPK
jgi:hypothetical protein